MHDATECATAGLYEFEPCQRQTNIAYTNNSGALEKKGRARLLVTFFLFQAEQTIADPLRDRALSIAAKAPIARPLAGTLSAGSLAAKALIAAARA